jgi:hypothetical protein
VLTIRAPPQVVFDVIASPYLGRTPRALAEKLQVWERGTDIVLAAHFTRVRCGVTMTLETAEPAGVVMAPAIQPGRPEGQPALGRQGHGPNEPTSPGNRSFVGSLGAGLRCSARAFGSPPARFILSGTWSRQTA